MIVCLDRERRAGAAYIGTIWNGDFCLACTEPIEDAIPPGTYRLNRDRSGRFRWWVIEGGPVGLAGTASAWTQVEIHEGNVASLSSLACVFPGLRVRRWAPGSLPGLKTSELGVEDSREALAVMLESLGDESDHYVMVRDLTGTEVRA